MTAHPQSILTKAIQELEKTKSRLLDVWDCNAYGNYPVDSCTFN